MCGSKNWKVKFPILDKLATKYLSTSSFLKYTGSKIYISQQEIGSQENVNLFFF